LPDSDAAARTSDLNSGSNSGPGSGTRVSITVADGIADVRLNRPAKRNALDNRMFAELAGASG